MSKARRRPRAASGARMPSWISDKENQKRWNHRFLGILTEDHVNLDASIASVLSDELLSQRCATRIRSYVDKGATNWWYRQSKARGAKHKKRLEIATVGLRTAIALCENRGDQESASSLARLTDQFSLELRRCKQAFATKRHGRDRDHSFLLECHSFLQKELGRPVTYVTLATLVNAGYEADGKSLKEPLTEERVRKNLANFKRNNPRWRLYDAP
jgi:hypothetical protein